MNGPHDLGGLDGFGPIRREVNEPVFHSSWEKRVFGMFPAMMALGFFNLDELRHGMERMDFSSYLGSSYYEHWLHAFETLLVEKGVVTADELASGHVEEVSHRLPFPRKEQKRAKVQRRRGRTDQQYFS